MNCLAKPDTGETGLILDQLVDVSSRLIAILEKISPQDFAEARLASPQQSLGPAPGPSRRVSLSARDLKRFLQMRARRRRKPHGQFLDGPAWDMLLDLAAVRAENAHVSVSAICISSGAPQSTALRKLAALESAGLVRRYLYGSDRRRVCLALTDEAAELVTNVIQEDLGFLAGLAPAAETA